LTYNEEIVAMDIGVTISSLYVNLENFGLRSESPKANFLPLSQLSQSLQKSAKMVQLMFLIKTSTSIFPALLLI
jgi:hypothetical protein